MIVRSAHKGDAEAIAAIYAHHVVHGTASFDTVARTVDETRGKIEEIIGCGWPFLVAEAEETVIGYAYATQFRDREAYRNTCENSIYVHTDRRGRGIGTTLLAALVTASENFGFRQMIAVIGGGEPSSVALHAKAGFDHVGQLKSVGRKFGRWLDTVYMQHSLGPGDREPPRQETATPLSSPSQK
jgi:L-amino acid N-acyltransferase YncA